jgi:hypothetical protein
MENETNGHKKRKNSGDDHFEQQQDTKRTRWTPSNYGNNELLNHEEETLNAVWQQVFSFLNRLEKFIQYKGKAKQPWNKQEFALVYS